MNFIPSLKSWFSLFSFLTIPMQIKTICDYNKTYASNQYNKFKMNKNEFDNISHDISKREQIMGLEKEREILLSSNMELKEEIKIKKMIKKKNITLK